MKKVGKVIMIVFAIIGIADTIFGMAKMIAMKVAPSWAGKMLGKLGYAYITAIRPTAFDDGDPFFEAELDNLD